MKKEYVRPTLKVIFYVADSVLLGLSEYGDETKDGEYTYQGGFYSDEGGDNWGASW